MDLGMVFAVYGHTDTTEGRGPMKLVCYARTREVAEGIVKSNAFRKYHVMGICPSDVSYHIREVPLFVHESVVEFNAQEEREKYYEALSKLTEEQREILGIKVSK